MTKVEKILMYGIVVAYLFLMVIGLRHHCAPQAVQALDVTVEQAGTSPEFVWGDINTESMQALAEQYFPDLDPLEVEFVWRFADLGRGELRGYWVIREVPSFAEAGSGR